MSFNYKKDGELIRIAGNAITTSTYNPEGTTAVNGQAVAEALKENGNFVVLTKAEYDALPSTKLTNGIYYFITD